MTRRLPRSLEDLRGLRAARWVRESTAGQFDRYGPDAQRELAGRAIVERFTLSAASCWLESGREVSARHFPTTGLRIRILDRRVARPLRALRSA